MTQVQNRRIAANWTLNCKGELLTIDRPLVMGILNVTPDSFHDGGSFNTVDKALKHAKKMLDEGADIIDIGGNSTRPGALPVSEKEEIERTIPIIEAIIAERPKAILSIDTWRGIVARMAIESGASIVNDVSAGEMDDNMLTTVAELNVPYVLMHMQGQPEHMQEAPEYNDVVGEVAHFFSKKLAQLAALGVNDVILDPGFGFGKTVDHNYSLLQNLEGLKIFNKPIMAGFSRKSMITNVITKGPKEALNGTTVMNTLAVLKKASILRVHDVAEAREVIDLVSRSV